MKPSLLELYAAVGGDRYVAHVEAALDAVPHGRRTWEAYDRHFGRFTGAGLDPTFQRLRHEGRRLALPDFSSAPTVVVIGDAPIDASTLASLEAHRDRIAILAGPAGARMLQEQGGYADIVLVEPCEGAGPFDLARLDSRSTCLLDRAAAVKWDTAGHVVHVAPSLPTWGVSPATAVAIGLESGVSTVAIAGVVAKTSDPRSGAIAALFELLAEQAPGRCVQLDGDSTPARGWKRGWHELDHTMPGRAVIEWVDHGSTQLLVQQARADLTRIAPILHEARQALTVSLDARDGRVSPRALNRAVETALAWGADSCLRWSLQQGLGLAFLPRLWRSGISMTPADRLWRPLVLALLELVEQADALAQVLDRLPAHEISTSRPDRRTTARALPGGRARVTAIVNAFGCDLSRLPEAISTLAAQTHPEIEVLVVHDGTNAGVIAALVHDPAGILPVAALSGATLDVALNRAIAASDAEFIAHHDADGVSHPERLARQVAYLQTHPDIDVLATATFAFDPIPDAGGRPRLCAPDAHTPDELASRLVEVCAMAHGSVLVRREAIVRAGGYRPPAGGASTTDHDLWLRLLPTTRFAKLPTRLYGRRVSLAGAAAAAPSRPGDRHAPAGSERAFADAQAGCGLAALELR